MPLFMDTHERVRAITPEGVRWAYERSLDVQSQHMVRYQRMWAHYDADDHGRLFCLVEAPTQAVPAQSSLTSDRRAVHA